MRRVGIGAELVTRPSILLLDEPTSALDAVNTRLVVQTLRLLASRGILVIASLHQPRFSVYQMLDKLLILREGELIFGGDRPQALPHLAACGFVPMEGENPADFFIEVAFGFVDSTANPLVLASQLAKKWVDKCVDDAAAERASRLQGSCTHEAFIEWFEQTHGAVLSATVEHLVWTAAQSKAAAGGAEVVDWAELHEAFDTWTVRRGERPGALRQFVVCVRRYFLQTVRGRKERFCNLMLVMMIGIICGFLSGPNPIKSNSVHPAPPRAAHRPHLSCPSPTIAVNCPSQILFAMLFGAAFSVVVATTTLGTFGSSVGERDLFRHEASCGTNQAAEGLARLTLDVVFVVLPLAPMFATPLHGMSASHIPWLEFVMVFVATAWAFTSLGPACAIFFPAAPAVANCAISFVLSIFLSGTMGLDPLSVVAFPGLSSALGFAADGLAFDGYGIFNIIPGFWTVTLQLMLTATARPFDDQRSFILHNMQDFGMLPDPINSTASEEAVHSYEVRASRWYAAGMLNLFLFGLLVRFLALAAFVVRNWDLKAMRRNVGARARSWKQ